MAEGRFVRVPVPLPAEGKTAGFEIEGQPLVLCNAFGEPYVIAGDCPHAGVALAPGVLRGCVLECPLHGGKLDVRTGKPVTPPIRRAARTHEVRLQDGGLEVWVDGA